MAIQSDDWDIRHAWLHTEVGGNGDYYITVAQEAKLIGSDVNSGLISRHTIRVSTSGSRYPVDVMLAVAHLHRTLEAYSLNSNEFNQELEFKAHETRKDRDDERSVATVAQ
jgi:hypothetical protein